MKKVVKMQFTKLLKTHIQVELFVVSFKLLFVRFPVDIRQASIMGFWKLEGLHELSQHPTLKIQM